MIKLRKNATRIGIVLFVVVFFFVVFISYFMRQAQISQIDKVFGVDVSSYQGEVNWKELEKQQIAFAFIKATQGTDLVDSEFARNWEEIDDTSIKKGAYLFYEPSEPVDQTLELFYDTVPIDIKALPPVIDIEIDKPEDVKKDELVKNLTKTVEGLSDHYHKTPIIYTNYRTYNNFLSDDFEDIKFWISDLDSNNPELKNHDWVFWQYTFRGLLNGIGEEEATFVDLDLYNGDLQQFKDEFDPSFIQLLGFY